MNSTIIFVLFLNCLTNLVKGLNKMSAGRKPFCTEGVDAVRVFSSVNTRNSFQKVRGEEIIHAQNTQKKIKKGLGQVSLLARCVHALLLFLFSSVGLLFTHFYFTFATLLPILTPAPDPRPFFWTAFLPFLFFFCERQYDEKKV